MLPPESIKSSFFDLGGSNPSPKFSNIAFEGYIFATMLPTHWFRSNDFLKYKPNLVGWSGSIVGFRLRQSVLTDLFRFGSSKSSSIKSAGNVKTKWIWTWKRKRWDSFDLLGFNLQYEYDLLRFHKDNNYKAALKICIEKKRCYKLSIFLYFSSKFFFFFLSQVSWLSHLFDSIKWPLQ